MVRSWTPELYEIMAAPQEVLKNCEAYLVRPRLTPHPCTTICGLISASWPDGRLT